MDGLLHKRLLFLILLSVVALNVVVFGGSRLILLDSFEQLEQQAVEENLLRVANAVRNEVENLGTLCADWAVWDDTYAFVQDQNSEYISSNLGALTLIDLNLNALLIFDANGTAVFVKGMDLVSEQLAEVPHELLNYFHQHKKFWPPLERFSRMDGLLVLSGKPILLSYRPILTSQAKGPARGILVMARWFDQALLEELGEQVALPLDMLPLGDKFVSSEPMVRIYPVDEHEPKVQGDVLLADLDGTPAFRLAIEMSRNLFRQGQSTVGFFQLCFLVISVVAGTLLYLLVVGGRRQRTVAEKRFRYVFENATDGLFVIEQSDKLTLINPAAKKLLGGVADLPQAEKVCFGHRELSELIRSGLAGKLAGPAEITLANPEKKLQIHLRAYMAPMLCENGKWHGTIATLQDISHEKELEQLKNEFIASAAHELNTPLSIIIGYTDLLMSGEYTGKDELHEHLQLINEKTHGLAKIVDDLLNVGKIESGRELHLEKESFDLADSLKQIAEVYQKESPRHQFMINLLDEDTAIVADRHRLGQVFDNLLSNAVKYSPAGGTITMTSSRHQNELLICVSDQGIGLTEAQVGKVFDKFYRADNSSTAVRGLGLGLNITRTIIEAHGGRIWLESTPGHGTKFYFTLPVIAPDSA